MFRGVGDSQDIDKQLGQFVGLGAHGLGACLQAGIAAAFGRVIDAKSSYTEGHSARVGELCDEIAAELGYAPEHRRALRRAAMLHDVGKLGVSSTIIEKPGKLDGEEWRTMQAHAARTTEILGRIAALSEMALIAGSHHERLDGRGYPLGVGAGLIAAGLVFALLAVVALVIAAVAGLAQVMPAWLAALIIAALFLVILAVLALIGISKIKKQLPLKPESAIFGLLYDLGVAKEGSGYTATRVRREQREKSEAKEAEAAEAKRKQESGEVPAELLGDLMDRMTADAPDFTVFFRALARVTSDDRTPATSLVSDPAALDEWLTRWLELGPDRELMDRTNPVYIPRNHLVEEALDAATGGDLAPFGTLLDAVTSPFSERAGFERYEQPAPEDFGPYTTYCGT